VAQITTGVAGTATPRAIAPALLANIYLHYALDL
jgi:hypothetical protein